MGNNVNPNRKRFRYSGVDKAIICVVHTPSVQKNNSNNNAVYCHRLLLFSDCHFAFDIHINTKWIVAKVKSTLRDQYIQKWHANIDSSSKGVTYKTFKTIFCLEKYLLLLQPKQWKPIIKLRTSNHCLPVETGRWNNTERHERNCTLCNDNELGDEYHYIFVCDNFRNERILLLPKYYTKRHNMLKCNEILNCKNRKH